MHESVLEREIIGDIFNVIACRTEDQCRLTTITGFLDFKKQKFSCFLILICRLLICLIRVFYDVHSIQALPFCCH